VLFLALVFLVLWLDLNSSFLLAILLCFIVLISLSLVSVCLPHFLLLLLYLFIALSRNFDADYSLVGDSTRKRLKPFQVIVLADLVDSFDELENVPATDNSVGIGCQQEISSIMVDLLHIFDPALMSFKMNAMLVISVLPYFDLSFLG
jgi:hypothetical protein